MIDKNMEHIIAVHLNVSSYNIRKIDSVSDCDGSFCTYVTFARNPGAVCPCDRSHHVKSNGYYSRRIVITDRLFENTAVYLKIPRCYCKDCLSSFSEDYHLAPARKTISYATVIKVMDLLKSPHMTFKEAAQLTGISESSVVRIFDEHCHIPGRIFPEAVCVDEVYSPAVTSGTVVICKQIITKSCNRNSPIHAMRENLIFLSGQMIVLSGDLLSDMICQRS